MTVAAPELLPVIADYTCLDADRVYTLIHRVGSWLLIGGEITKGIFRYPTEEQVLAREGGATSGKTLRLLMRVPELFLHRDSVICEPGTPVRILCRPDSPDFVMGELFYTEGAMYRVSLHHAQPDPVDTGGRGWR